MTEQYGPFVPLRVPQDDKTRISSVEPASVEDLAPRPVPEGADRRGRREWEISEGERLARVQQRVPAQERPSGPPAGLNRRARRGWRAERTKMLSELNRRRHAEEAPTRSVGVLVVMAVLAVAAVVWWFVPRSPEPTTATPSVVATRSPAASTVPVVEQGAAAAAAAWYRIACPSTIAAPQPVRWASTQSLMTPDGFVSGAPTIAQPVEWECVNITATAASDDPARVVVYVDATRKLEDGTRTQVHLARVMERVDGRWLVGVQSGAG